MNRLLAICLVMSGLVGGVTAADELIRDFQHPPETTKPYCYWYWLNNDITADGITRDLEAMAHTGIRLAMIGNIEGGGPVKMFSPEWYQLTRHALQEAHRVGVGVMMFNAPGWSQSGGPWIKPEQSMRRVIWNEMDAQGGKFSARVRNAPQDIAVLAVPRRKAVALTGDKCPTSADGIDMTKSTGKTNGGNKLWFCHTEPFAARALVVQGSVNGKLYAVKDGKRELVAVIQTGGRNPATDFLPDGVETFSFKDTIAQEFVLEPCKLDGARVTLTSEPRVAQVIEKQLGRLHPTPSPEWDSYIFPHTVEPEDAASVISRNEIINLTDKLDAEGVLTCELPAGDWTVIYFGMVTTGKKNSPAPPEATGLEVDKMSRPLVEHHFNSMFGKLLKDVTPAEKSAWKGITIDSYEKGAQNWTDNFDREFKKRNGYDPIALLPVFTGRVVDSAKVSDQFLWDLRRTVADMVATEYVAGLRDIAHENGLTLWCENYGHWGFPSEFLVYGRYSDEIGGEFWTTTDLGSIECRAASSAAHIYGKSRVYAEAFTSGLDLNHHPYKFKARGEELFCEGINHFVLHVMVHQPRDGAPGKNPWFGTAFHRNNPWFNQARDWVTYLQRVHFMLQKGMPVANVAVYIGDFAPQMTGPANPVPAGYDYDYMGSDAILNNLDVVNGKWVVYDEKKREKIAACYELLAIPKSGYVRPRVLKRLEDLKKAGGKVVEAVPVPVKSLKELGVVPIVSESTCPLRWKARQLDDGMLFFLSNFGQTGKFEVTLRVTGKVPELFNPATGEIRKLARYKAVKNGTRICINVNDRSDSFFIVFRDKVVKPSVVSVKTAGKDVAPVDLELSYGKQNVLTAASAKKGNYTLGMSDGTEMSVAIDTDSRELSVNGSWKSTALESHGYTVKKEVVFSVPAGFGQGQRVRLDLGAVEVMAKVSLNGKEFELLWMPPFDLDVTDVLKSGENKLEITVTSTVKGKPKLGEVKLRTVSVKEIAEPGKTGAAAADERVTFTSLLDEMTDRSVLTRWPRHEYKTLQASSYNRAAKTPDDPSGWFANADCGYFIRTEKNQGRDEFVLMEHQGPGVITRIWTPFFHYDFNNRAGSDILIYIDGNPEPVIAENFISLATGKGSVKIAPFSQYTVRSGVIYLPIPYSKSIKITHVGKPFYYIINYRAYESGTEVESFTPELLSGNAGLLENTAEELMTPSSCAGGETVLIEKDVPAGQSEVIDLQSGPAAVRQLEFKLDAVNITNALRSTVFEMTCDGEQTIWCPIGDFFSNVNSMDPAHRMWERDTLADGTMICRWIMPYRESARITIRNLAKAPVALKLKVATSDWDWTGDTMYFFTRWWTDDPWAPRPVRDMNFIDIEGRGIFVGDTLSVLNPHWSWWGEGDEKIFVDEDVERRFPSHFGTGTEDYYGWAGGEVPTRKDEFSAPFVANVRVGGKGNHTHGYNICSRTRSLDAIPFKNRFKFDMEAYNMINSPEAFLQYSLVTHWYGRPGAKHNKPSMPDWAAKPVPQTEDVQDFVRKVLAADMYFIKDAIELEDLKTVKLSSGLRGGKQNLESLRPLKWSGNAHFRMQASVVGQSAEFTLQEQYHARRIILYAARSVDYGRLNIYVNDKAAIENWDGYSANPEGSQPIDLGIHQPDGNVIRIKVEVAGKNDASKGYFCGLDCVILEDPLKQDNR